MNSAVLLLCSACVLSQAGDPAVPSHRIKYRFQGFIGERLKANVDNWILRAPAANPGMLEMFRNRDREPPPKIVPWAGEFVGKYLLSAIYALDYSDDPRLEPLVKSVVAALIRSQAEDGYLGPFPKRERLLGNWDLWGHYHCMLALLAWHERTGDAASIECCKRMADLMVRTFVGGKRTVFDAGSHEMNMAVIHSLAKLQRSHPNPRYAALIEQIEKDWERAGDYFRTGKAGVEFFRTPRPRWESLHDLQALVELARLKKNSAYTDAFMNHWWSIRCWDRRNTGGFSSGEQATGNPFAATPIETCCSVAWALLTLDALKATDDGRIADEYELTYFNALLGAQHPSGNWCTYDTPMDGVRESSAHAIVFQARAGTPDLNCCSVNGPRGLGSIVDWAIVRNSRRQITINHLGPMEAVVPDVDCGKLRVRITGDYPRSSSIAVEFSSDRPFGAIAVSLRFPGWAERPTFHHEGQEPALIDFSSLLPAEGLRIPFHEEFKLDGNAKRQVVVPSFQMPIRAEAGERDMVGRVSLYRGPILLACDVADDDQRLGRATIDASILNAARLVDANATSGEAVSGLHRWVKIDLSAKGGTMHLCDFASAGARGTPYNTWFAAKGFPPSAPVPSDPPPDAEVGRKVTFRWRRIVDPDVRFDLLIGDPSKFLRETVAAKDVKGNSVTVDLSVDQLTNRTWRVVAKNVYGKTYNAEGFRTLRVRPDQKPSLGVGAGSRVIALKDNLAISSPVNATRKHVPGAAFTPKGVELDGRSGRITYETGDFPSEEYSLALWVKPLKKRTGVGQISSAWCAAMDDPMRLCIDGDRIFARLESPGGGASTPGVPAKFGEWQHLAVVKDGAELTLFVDGKIAATAIVPAVLRTKARDFAIGGNPHYSGDEFLAMQARDLHFEGRAFSQAEINALAGMRPK